ncbi:hypothetical protein LXL04_010079 [Taraxacum kok-saghyz]
MAIACIWMQKYNMTSSRKSVRIVGIQKSPIVNLFGEYSHAKQGANVQSSRSIKFDVFSPTSILFYLDSPLRHRRLIIGESSDTCLHNASTISSNTEPDPSLLQFQNNH